MHILVSANTSKHIHLRGAGGFHTAERIWRRSTHVLVLTKTLHRLMPQARRRTRSHPASRCTTFRPCSTSLAMRRPSSSDPELTAGGATGPRSPPAPRIGYRHPPAPSGMGVAVAQTSRFVGPPASEVAFTPPRGGYSRRLSQYCGLISAPPGCWDLRIAHAPDGWRAPAKKRLTNSG